MEAVVLVEGASDQAAVETAARRLGRDLDSEGIAVIPMGGASRLGEYLLRYGPAGEGVAVAGLGDHGELADFRRGLEAAGFGSRLTVEDMETLGFYFCVADLEEELIRVLGVDRVLRIFEIEGELRSFRVMQSQPAWRGRPTEDQMRRFIGAKSGRKVRYGSLLVEGVEVDNLPRPLRLVLDHV
jgi:hypothetical protein